MAPRPEQPDQETLDRPAAPLADHGPEQEIDGLFEAERPTLRERLSAALGFGKPELVRATIVLERADQLVLTFVTAKPLDWSPAAILELRVGGRTIQVRLDLAATTAAAKLGAGVTVRVTVILVAALPPGSLELDVCGLRLTANR